MSHATPDAAYATAIDTDTVRLVRMLPGPVERVWAYLTDGDLRRQWLAAGEMQPRAGAGFELVWRNNELTDPAGTPPDGFGDEHRMASTVTAFDPPRRLGFTWDSGGEVSIELEPVGDEVRLVLVHRRLRDLAEMRNVGPGWHAHLDLLVARVAGTQPEPFWDAWRRLKPEYDRRLPA